jgi:hypothetical protein
VNLLTDEQIEELLERNGFARDQETLGIFYGANEVRISVPAADRRQPATVIVTPLELLPEASPVEPDDERQLTELFEREIRP